MAQDNAIPQRIHLIWFGPMTDLQHGRIQAWKRLNPGWEVTVWTRMTDLVNQDLFDAAVSVRRRADIARYEIVHRHGGYYFDLDFDPLRGLAEAGVPTKGLVVCRESANRWAQGFFASPAGHPFLSDLIEALAAQPPGADVPDSQATGPGFFTTQLAAWKQNHDVSEIVRDRLYPYNFDKLHRAAGPWSDQVIAVHRWEGTVAQQPDPSPTTGYRDLIGFVSGAVSGSDVVVDVGGDDAAFLAAAPSRLNAYGRLMIVLADPRDFPDVLGRLQGPSTCERVLHPAGGEHLDSILGHLSHIRLLRIGTDQQRVLAGARQLLESGRVDLIATRSAGGPAGWRGEALGDYWLWRPGA